MAEGGEFEEGGGLDPDFEAFYTEIEDDPSPPSRVTVTAACIDSSLPHLDNKPQTLEEYDYIPLRRGVLPGSHAGSMSSSE